MSTKNRSMLTKAVAGFLGGAFALVTVSLLLHAYGPGNMGKGAAQGGTVMLIIFAFAIWRVAQRPQRASTFERTLTGSPDERDERVATQSAAVVGLVAIPAVGAAAVAIAIGAPAVPTLAILLYALIAVATVSFIIAARRN